jgi:pimeloyl-ACP methyl ester carboxylesterase
MHAVIRGKGWVARVAASAWVAAGAWVAATALVAPAAVNAAPANAPAALTLTSCEVKELSQPARCGSLEVPENPQHPEGRHIAIHVMVIPATTSHAQPDPIVPLMGGPGEDAISAAADFARRLASLRADRDLLLVDQRGSGQSGALHCNLYSPDNPATSLRDLFPVKAVKKCERDLRSRVDLTQYTYTRFASDLEQVRLALSYQKLNLFAGSYGTRAAQVFIRAFPNSVRTMYLGSVIPIDIANPVPFAATSQTALERTFAHCLADIHCKAAFPNLRAEFTEIVKRLDAGSIRVPIAGSADTAALNRGRVAEWIRAKLYRPYSATDVPWMIHKAYLGDWRPIAEGILANAREVDGGLSFGLFFSITCNDDVPFIREEDVRTSIGNTFLGDYRVRQQQAACSIWPKHPPPQDYRHAVVSDVPTLFVSGDLDGAAPASFMEHTAKGFSNGVTLVQRGQGHTEWNRCIADLYRQLVTGGSTKDMKNAQCAPVPRPRFKTD